MQANTAAIAIKVHGREAKIPLGHYACWCYGIMSIGASMATDPRVYSFIGVKPMSDLELATMTEKGLPLASIDRLKRHGLSFTEIADVVISPRTLKHRKARREPLSSVETERVVRVARIVELAKQVFGSREKALLWLRSPDDRLNRRTPMQMLVNEPGGRLIENLLWQVDEGIYS
jgi:putative toxin-antitoxin system antitoxin component (TIGR02293 family)